MDGLCRREKICRRSRLIRIANAAQCWFVFRRDEGGGCEFEDVCEYRACYFRNWGGSVRSGSAISHEPCHLLPMDCPRIALPCGERRAIVGRGGTVGVGSPSAGHPQGQLSSLPRS